uniref:Uncharacterized protein n=1 Tax=Rhizophagus irregularis (strain DAOM 181602 / DAOM 197198 / MUCL 43194) TaxID=747089 RepID=U9UT58_RHIID
MVWYGICFELYEELKNSINLRARMKCVTILDDDMDIMGQLLGSRKHHEIYVKKLFSYRSCFFK